MNRTDEPQFIDIIKQHEGMIHRICGVYADDAESVKDLFQEIVLQAWTAYPRFNHTAKPSTWLYRIALNTAISYLRKEKKQSKPKVGIDKVVLPNTIADDRTEEFRVMHDMIALLPPLEKALILLYLDDKNHVEIANILGITVSNVSTRLMRIREKLKKQVKPLFK